MIRLQSEQPWNVGPFAFPAGTFYVEAATAADAMLLQPVTVATVDNPKPYDPGADPDSILVCRSGGFGDLLFMTPLLRALRARHPRARITFATADHYADAIRHHPAVDGLAAYPVPAAVLERHDAVLWFEGAVEWDPRARTTHYVDLLAAVAGIELTQGRNMNVALCDDWRKTAAERWPRRYARRIGVQLAASAKCRTWPHIGRFIQLALELPDTEVLVFDSPDDFRERSELRANLVWLPWSDPAPTFGESMALLETCHAVVAPDSAICHAAAALGRPVVAVYGSFPRSLRTIYEPSVQTFSGQLPCAPCFWHARSSEFPPDAPCAVTRRCEALARIAPERILAKVRPLLPPAPKLILPS